MINVLQLILLDWNQGMVGCLRYETWRWLQSDWKSFINNFDVWWITLSLIQLDFHDTNLFDLVNYENSHSTATLHTSSIVINLRGTTWCKDLGKPKLQFSKLDLTLDGLVKYIDIWGLLYMVGWFILSWLAFGKQR